MDTAANQELTKHQALINLVKWRGSSRMGSFFFCRRPSGVRAATPLRAEMNNDHVVAVACWESFIHGRNKRYCVNLIQTTGAQTHPFTATSLTTVGVLINPGSTRIYIGTGASHKSGLDICFITVTSWFLVLHLKRHRCSPHSINDVPLKAHQRGIVFFILSTAVKTLAIGIYISHQEQAITGIISVHIFDHCISFIHGWFLAKCVRQNKMPKRGCGSLFAGYEPLK